jgi:hypothetical protein
VPTACLGSLARADYFSFPVLTARASMLVAMPRRFLALMPLAIFENRGRTAAGQVGPILEGSCVGARWY